MKKTVLVSTAGKPYLLRITLRSAGKARVTLQGIDAQKTQTVFFKRQKSFQGKTVLQINLPVAPQKLVLRVESDVRVSVEVQKTGLPAREQVEISEDTADFIDHAEEFCLHASYLPADQIYTNEVGAFGIEYVPRLFSMEGEELSGPAKVNRGTGHITINSTLFKQFTVPMRIFILLHEWFHYHENTGHETTVDIYALQVYLSLGFPKLEVMNATAGLFEDKKGLISRVETIFEYLKNYQEQPVCNTKMACL